MVECLQISFRAVLVIILFCSMKLMLVLINSALVLFFRHRRARRQSKDIDPIDLHRVGALSLEDDPFSQSNEPNPVSQTNEPNPILQAQLVQGKHLILNSLS